MGAALAEALLPSSDQYVAGFQRAAFAMSLVAFGGVLALLWPTLQDMRSRFGSVSAAGGAELGGRQTRIVGASD